MDFRSKADWEKSIDGWFVCRYFGKMPYFKTSWIDTLFLVSGPNHPGSPPYRAIRGADGPYWLNSHPGEMGKVPPLFNESIKREAVSSLATTTSWFPKRLDTATARRGGSRCRPKSRWSLETEAVLWREFPVKRHARLLHK